jgi:hypothetical protein
VAQERPLGTHAHANAHARVHANAHANAHARPHARPHANAHARTHANKIGVKVRGKRFHTLRTMLPASAAGLPLGSALRQLLLFVAGGVCLNMLVRACVPRSWRAPTRNVARDGEAAAFYAHVLCASSQVAVFPTLYMLSVLQYPDLRSHCASSWAECAAVSAAGAAGTAGGGVCWMRVYAMVMIAYLAKDLPFCNTIEIVHHVAGIVVTLGFFLTERGMYGYMTGCVTLEFANIFMNLAHIWPHASFGASRLFMYRLNVFANTASHVLGLYVTYFTFVNRGENDSTAFFVAFAVAALAVMLIRQQINYGNYCIVRDSKKE